MAAFGTVVAFLAALQPPQVHRPPQLPRLGRRAALVLSGGVVAATSVPSPAHASVRGADWPLWPALPLAPYSRRKTVMREAVVGRAWTFDQLLGVFYVHVPIRMTVVRMDAGGLLVYAPVAPTKECLALLQPLINAHGPVRHIILPSVAPEHKVLAGPFARQFRDAEFWTTDAQYAFPLNLPATWLGFPGIVKQLPSRGDGLFGGEFKLAVISAKASKESIYQDAALFHEPSKTLLLCDAAVSVTEDPPAILTSEPEYVRALLYHARDDPLEKVVDTPEVRRKGWQRIALFGNFFMPGSLRTLDQGVWLPAAPQSPMPELGWGGVLPFTWTEKTPLAFERFAQGGAPVVVPIIQIILSRAPEASAAWLDTICSWPFETVIPAHFDAPFKATPTTLRKAFAFLDTRENRVRFCDEDVAFLREALEGLPPDLALFDTPFGPLRGEKCGLDNGGEFVGGVRRG